MSEFAVDIRGMDGVKTALSSIHKELQPEFLRDLLGPMVQAAIVDRTFGRGKDVRDANFKRLAESTKRQKKKKGQPTDSRLTATGMLSRAVYYSKPRKGIDVRNVGNRSAIGHYHNTGDGVPRREWLGLSPKDRQAIGGLIEPSMSKRIAKVVRPGMKVKGKAFHTRGGWWR